MERLSWILIAGAVLLAVYAYVGYPLLLVILERLGGRVEMAREPAGEWPTVSITVPAYNEEHQIAETLASLLALDYPADRRQILIVSDASTDRTDEIVRSFADRGVELVRQPERRGKTAAENAVAPLLRGEIVVNTDASIRIHPESLKRLIAPMTAAEVGLASGRDVSVGREDREANQGEAGYVGYEMWVRDLETRTGSIVGASGCFYAIRRELHGVPLPGHLSRDFAAALHTRERGLRAVSVGTATCTVPRAGALAQEYRRKVRTMGRGMETLRYKRALLNPFTQGLFAWKLFSHKVVRWLVPWAGIGAFAGLLWLVAGASPVALCLVLGLTALAGAATVLAVRTQRPLPRAIALPAFAILGNVAVLHATLRTLIGSSEALWEPTRRGGTERQVLDEGNSTPISRDTA